MVTSIKKYAIALGYYSDCYFKDLSLRVKHGEKDAILEVAPKLASFVNKDSVLVPIPGHLGECTYTWEMAKAIAKISGATIIDALGGFARKSSYECKQEGKLHNKAVWFFKREDVPAKKHIVLIDNVVATGETANAARMALGNRGVVLAISISSRNKKHKVA